MAARETEEQKRAREVKALQQERMSSAMCNVLDTEDGRLVLISILANGGMIDFNMLDERTHAFAMWIVKQINMAKPNGYAELLIAARKRKDEIAALLKSTGGKSQ